MVCVLAESQALPPTQMELVCKRYQGRPHVAATLRNSYCRARRREVSKGGWQDESSDVEGRCTHSVERHSSTSRRHREEERVDGLGRGGAPLRMVKR